MALRHMTNTQDPSSEWFQAPTFPGHSPVEALKYHRAWLADKTIGDPKATETYTVEELKRMGMVGVYTNKPPRKGGK